jgi:ferritin
MLKPQILELLNNQLNNEFYSAYLYLAMSSYFDSVNLEGFAAWSRTKAQEEMEHAMKMYNYIIDRNDRVRLFQIEAPRQDWESPLEAIEDAYNHERDVTERIHAIMHMARDTKDYSTEVFIHWYVNEQIEEEISADKVLQKIRMVKDSPGGMLILDGQVMKLAQMPHASLPPQT